MSTGNVGSIPITSSNDFSPLALNSNDAGNALNARFFIRPLA
jgi:hypothetical protein